MKTISNKIIISKGTLVFDPPNYTKKHSKQSSWKKYAMINIEDDFCEYYSWIIEKRFNLKLNKPIRGSHVTIINDKFDDNNAWNDLKNKWEGEEINFLFSWDEFRSNAEHFYFKVACPTGENIRNEINLGEPYYDFHITIGYVPLDSEVRYAHSEYILRQMKKFNL